MTSHTIQLTGQLARAARALIGVSSKHVAKTAGMSRDRVRDLENGNATITADESAALRSALEQLGAVFIADGDGGRGHGVRLKFSATKVEKIESWEGEGGFAADDDV